MGATAAAQRSVIVLVCAALVVVLGVAPGSALAACSNESLRQQQGVGYLPDCMALEMVTPPAKANRLAGQAAIAPSISANGERVIYESAAPLAETEGQGSPLGDTYVATRGPGGWSTQPTAPPAGYGYGWGGVSNLGYPLSMTPEFDRWLSLQATTQQAQNGQMTVYEADLAGTWTARSPLLLPLDGFHNSQLIKEIPFDLSGASQNLSHLFMRPANAFAPQSNGAQAVNGYSTAYLSGDPQPRRVDSLDPSGEAATWNTYVLTRGPLGQPQLALMARDSVGKAWGGNCGAFLGGGGLGGQLGGRNQGAVSSDGSLAYFSTRPAQPQPNPSNPTFPRCVGAGTAAIVVKNNPVITTVTTAEGTGRTSEATEPTVVREVSTGSGAFEVGQGVEITGSTVAAGTTIVALEEETETLLRVTLSNPVTAGGGAGKKLKAGAAPFAVGEELTAATSCLASKPCFEPGTTITAVNGRSITVSPPPLETGTSVALRAVAPLRIMKREEAAAGQATIGELIPGGPAVGSDYFEGASDDQQRVYLTSPRKLAATDQDTGTGECAGTNSSAILTFGSSLGCDLYLDESLPGGGHELVQVSAGDPTDPTPGAGAGVFKGVTAISGDGSHVYFGAQGALTEEPNPEGAVAIPPASGQGTLTSGSAVVTGLSTAQGEFLPGMGISGNGIPVGATIQAVGAGTLTLSTSATAGGPQALHAADLNLYAYQRDGAHPGGKVSFVGELDAACTQVGNISSDCLDVVAGRRSYWNEAAAVPIHGSGSTLVFESTAPLTANDKDGRRLDVFRYRADADPPTLECVSCLPGNVEDAGAFDVSHREIAGHLFNPGLEFAQQQRWVSEDGGSVVFATAEALLPQDVDGRRSDYLWQSGKLTLLPGSGEKPTIAGDGSEVAFETPDALLPQDGDSATDVYLARAFGGFPNPPEEAPCAGESCQGPPSASPPAPSAATQSFTGRGNAKAAKHKKKHHKKKHRKHGKKRHGKRTAAKHEGGRK